jgi:hypothetical protein
MKEQPLNSSISQAQANQQRLVLESRLFATGRDDEAQIFKRKEAGAVCHFR